MKWGSNGENQLANRLTDEGWFCMRAAGSGTAQRDMCDLLAINSNSILIIECKTFDDGSRRLGIADDVDQLEAIEEVARIDNRHRGGRILKNLICLKEDGSRTWRYIEVNGQGSVIPNDVDNYLFSLLLRLTDVVGDEE